MVTIRLRETGMATRIKFSQTPPQILDNILKNSIRLKTSKKMPINPKIKPTPPKINATGKPLKRNKNVKIKKIITISIFISCERVY